MARMSLLPGYRFHPTDVELVMYYLKRKVLGKRLHVNAVAEVNIYMFSPWDLPDKSALKSNDLEWFFFCPREKKYASGSRVKRATEHGYWKTTGKDRTVSYEGKDVGIVKTLVFHLGHPPNGERTDWVMYEYRILDEQSVAAGVQDNYVLCKVFQKSGPGPKLCAQYGAPYNEADWVDSDGDDAHGDPATYLRSDGVFPTAPMLIGHELQLIEKGPSNALDTSTNVLPIEDEVACLLRHVESKSTSDENTINQAIDGDGIFGDLTDLDEWAPMTGNTLDLSGVTMNDSSLLGMQQECDYLLDYTLPEDDSFIELEDLHKPLPEPAGFSGIDLFTVDDSFGLDDFLLKENDLSSEFDQFSSGAQPPVLSEMHNQPDNCLLNALHMVDDLDFIGADSTDISGSIQGTERVIFRFILRMLPATRHGLFSLHSGFWHQLRATTELWKNKREKQNLIMLHWVEIHPSC